MKIHFSGFARLPQTITIITVDLTGPSGYIVALTMTGITMARRFSYYSFTYRYPYGMAATVKRMRAGDSRM
ncbi:MAG: hypothetical protein ACYDDI_06130 [Candidatus Acidiferrales bacterium]